jgi:hypothetical protein
LIQCRVALDNQELHKDALKPILVFDDGGFTTTDSDGSGQPIPLAVYNRIAELAEKHNVAIPIAVTAKYIDVNNIAGCEMINPNAEWIIQFFKDHTDTVPLWNHGLTHQFGDEFTEFYNYPKEKALSEEEHHKHFSLSQKIFEEVGLSTKVFVPPGHGWEQGLTDRIASKYGVDTIAIREFEKTSGKDWLKNPFKPYKKEWESSSHLNTMYRLGLGISYNKSQFTKSDLDKAGKYLRPANILQNLSIHRTLRTVNSPNHYFAHVQNIRNPESVHFFNDVIQRILNSSNLI